MRTPVSHPLVVILIYLGAVFFGAALAAPRFQASAQFLAEQSHAWRGLAEQPFHRYVSRALILFAIVGLPLFLKALRISSLAGLGLFAGKRNLAEAAQGLVWGFAALALVCALSVASGNRIWNLDHTAPEITRHIRNTLATALVVALIEEVLFRGALFGAMRRRHRFWTAAILSSAFYALVHFFERPGSPTTIHWYSGFTTLAQMCAGFANWKALVPGFFNLILIGVILAVARERTGSLLFSIGFHASIVFWVKTLGFTTRLADSSQNWVFGGTKAVDGWVSGAILLVLLAAIWPTLPKIRKHEE